MPKHIYSSIKNRNLISSVMICVALTGCNQEEQCSQSYSTLTYPTRAGETQVLMQRMDSEATFAELLTTLQPDVSNHQWSYDCDINLTAMPADYLPPNYHLSLPDGSLDATIGSALVMIKGAELFAVNTDGTMEIIDSVQIQNPAFASTSQQLSSFPQLYISENQIFITTYRTPQQINSAFNLDSPWITGAVEINAFVYTNNQFSRGDTYLVAAGHEQDMGDFAISIQDNKLNMSTSTAIFHLIDDSIVQSMPATLTITSDGSLRNVGAAFDYNNITVLTDQITSPTFHTQTTCELSDGGSFSECSHAALLGNYGTVAAHSSIDSFLHIHPHVFSYQHNNSNVSVHKLVNDVNDLSFYLNNSAELLAVNTTNWRETPTESLDNKFDSLASDNAISASLEYAPIHRQHTVQTLPLNAFDQSGNQIVSATEISTVVEPQIYSHSNKFVGVIGEIFYDAFKTARTTMFTTTHLATKVTQQLNIEGEIIGLSAINDTTFIVVTRIEESHYKGDIVTSLLSLTPNLHVQTTMRFENNRNRYIPDSAFKPVVANSTTAIGMPMSYFFNEPKVFTDGRCEHSSQDIRRLFFQEFTADQVFSQQRTIDQEITFDENCEFNNQHTSDRIVASNDNYFAIIGDHIFAIPDMEDTPISAILHLP